MKYFILLLGFIPFFCLGNTGCAEAFSETEIKACLKNAYIQSAKSLKESSSLEIEEQLPNEHPFLYWTYALALYKNNKIEKATFWYYAGMLRYEFYLSATPGLKGSGEEQLYNGLKNTFFGISVEIETFIYSKKSIPIVKAVLKWDAENVNGFTSKRQFKKQLTFVRDRMSKKIEMLGIELVAE